jgi:hypothetical protein
MHPPFAVPAAVWHCRSRQVFLIVTSPNSGKSQPRAWGGGILGPFPYLLPDDWIRTNLQQVQQRSGRDALGATNERTGDTRQNCIPLVRFEHVRGLICGYSLILVDLFKQINTRWRKQYPP